MVLILILSALIFNLYVLTLIIFWKKKADLWNIQRPVSTSASDRWVKWGFFFFWVQICERLIGKDQPPLILSLRGNLKSISLVRMSICLPNSTILAFLSRLVIARNWSSILQIWLVWHVMDEICRYLLVRGSCVPKKMASFGVLLGWLLSSVRSDGEQ